MPTEGTSARTAGFALDPFLVPRYKAGGQGPHIRATLVGDTERDDMTGSAGNEAAVMGVIL